MKYLKTYENTIKEPYVGNWVVAHRPFKDKFDNENDIVMSYNDYSSVFDIGRIIRKVTDDDKSESYFSVNFGAGGNYIRRKQHFFFISNNKEEAEEYLTIVKTANKYNL